MFEFYDKKDTSKMTLAHAPCPHPSCSSSDAYCEYIDSSTYCFSCKTYEPPEKLEREGESYSFQYAPFAGITENTLRRYDIRVKVREDGVPVSIGYPYGGGLKERRLSGSGPKYVVHETEEFKKVSLFGMDRFNAGGRAIVITEGEKDAASVYEILGIPAVSLSSGANSASTNIRSAYEYLNTYERIYLCFDNDEQGHKATQTAANILPFDKVFIINLTKHKDANDYLVNGDKEDFRSAFQYAKKFTIDGVISSYHEIEEALEETPRKILATYPFPCLQIPLDGLGESEVVLLTGLEGIGKTEIMRAFEHHVLKTTDHSIGIVHLEETKSATINGLIGYELQVPMKRSDQIVSKVDRMNAFKNLTKKDDRTYIYTHYGSDNIDEILNIVRYLVAVCGCKIVFFDHVNIAVSGLRDDDERRTLDYLTTQLAMMCERLKFNLVMVSHLNDDGLTRGSRNTSKVAHVHVTMNRNTEHPNKEERNKLFLTIRKNRPTQETGPITPLVFDESLGILKQFVPGVDDFIPKTEGEAK